MAGDRQTPPQGDPPQAPARTGWSRTRVLIVGGVLLGLLVCAAVIVGALVIFSSGDGKQKAVKPWALSADQRRVVAAFGPPQTFSVICATDPKNDDLGKDGFPIHRVETWSYHELGAQFFFRDGRATGETRTPVVPAGTHYPKLRPEEFARDMSVEDVVKVIGAAPTKAADIAPDIFKGLEVYVFGDQVMAEFDNGRLVGVQTTPVIPTGGKQ